MKDEKDGMEKRKSTSLEICRRAVYIYMEETVAFWIRSRYFGRRAAWKCVLRRANSG